MDNGKLPLDSADAPCPFNLGVKGVMVALQKVTSMFHPWNCERDLIWKKGFCRCD